MATGTQKILESVTQLRSTGRYSDLVLACKDRRFPVHRAVLCSRSPVFEAASEGGFWEGINKVIDIVVADTDTLEYALSYLYTGGYDEAIPLNHDNVIDPIIQSRSFAKKTQRDEMTTRSRSRSAVHEGGSESPSPLHHEQQGLTGADLSLQQEEPSKETSSKIGRNAKLCANTDVYVFADYYQIPDLKELAVKKFEVALEDSHEEGFHEVCHMVYDTTSSSDLRSMLSRSIASAGTTLLEDESFMKATLSLPELLRDCFIEISRQYRAVCEDRDAILGAKLKAEDIAKEANKKGQEEKQRVIAQVNQARQCRHCSLQNNVLFEQEWSHLGSAEYSFRCRCRTRY